MRRHLWAALPLAFSAMLSSAAQDNVRAANTSSPPWESIDLGGLTEIRSAAGVLATTLHAVATPVSIDGAHFEGATYDGQYGGPVLHVRAGDHVLIKLVNDLNEPTNLHFHGLHITPRDHGDNMHLVVLPHTAIQYDFHIPADHPPGLFWFHDHMHGLAEKHVTAGLAGTILIDGFAGQFSTLKDVPQRLLILKDYADPACTDPRLKAELHCRLLSVNGQAGFTAHIHQGETQLWRIANLGANFIIHLAIPGATLRIIGRDGLPTAQAEAGGVLDVLPAGRIDILVTAQAIGPSVILAQHVPTGTGEHFTTNRMLGTLDVAAPGVKGPPGNALVTPIFPTPPDLRTLAIDARRVVTFSEDSTAMHYFIDGRMFDHDRIDVRVPLGNVEEWTIRNQTQDFHEFHIHQLAFQVVEINGAKKDFAGLVDTVLVPEMGEVKLILPFTSPVMVGQFMFHCHVLKHEDAGMMANIEVYRPGEAVAPRICRPHAEQGGAL